MKSILIMSNSFPGDSPARAFESGNQINGHFPCHCGIDIRVCNTHSNFLKPKYLDIFHRLAVIKETDRWDKRARGELSVFDNLNVSTQNKVLRCALYAIFFPQGYSL